MDNVLKRIEDYALEEIMGERFASYAKEIIQDRAIPDVRDGLKPVQRRILFAMYKAGNTYDKKYIKSAATVGDVLGKYHPHGDSSVYAAMVRMSQWWKQNTPLIDMKGNNGSMDGDPAAAYRYTEARLAKISNELLGDLDKNTVKFAPNFDDRLLEPTVLPAKFPNLLVNGAMGISAGYATNIPPHNLGEIIDATIKRIDSPNCYLDTILDIVKGPDFPTGGIACGIDGIREAFKTGKGRVVVRCKYDIVREKGKTKIVITEIPYDVNKAMLVNKIDGIRIDKKIDGMTEVRDESDREGLRIVIDLKAGANPDLKLSYLFKNTDLQISYNYNMVTIVGAKASGVKGINLKDDNVKNMVSFNASDEYLTIFTDNKTAKRVKLSDLETHNRAKRGSLIMKKTKTVTYKILNALVTNSRDLILTKADSDINIFKNSDIAIMDLTSTGSNISKYKLDQASVVAIKEKIETPSEAKNEEREKEEKKEPKKLSMEDFLDDFKL